MIQYLTSSKYLVDSSSTKFVTTTISLAAEIYKLGNSVMSLGESADICFVDIQ